MAKFARLPTRPVKMKGRKARTWAKGHSSDSNPTITKFREIALKSRFVINESLTKIVVDKSKKKIRFADEEVALKKSENLLEKLTLDDKKDRSDDDEDNQSSVETAETQFTNFTNCTNPTFNKVHRLWKSGSDIQSEVLTVLAAVTEVIKASDEPESELAYFGALMNSFSQPDQSVKTLAAISYLLSLVICKVSYGALSACFSTVSQDLYAKLIQYADKPEANALIKYTIECMGVLLKAQPLHVWESASTGKMFDSLLTFTIDQRPKIRKASQRAAADIINYPMTGLESSKIHPASKNCSTFCTDIINQYADNEKAICTTLYSILLLQKCMHNLGQSSFKHSTETLLNLAQVSKATLNQAVFRCLEGVFSNRPSDLTLTSDMTKQITLALYTLEPNKNDQFTYLQWCKVVAEIHQCLVEKDKVAFTQMFPKFFEVLVNFLSLVDQNEVVYGTVILIKRVIQGCLNDSLAERDSIKVEFCQRITTLMEHLLSLRYFNIWPHCFDILTSFFAVCSNLGEKRPELFDFTTLLKSMAELRESGDFLHVAQLDKCIGSAIRYCGPNYVLQSIPLNIDIKKPGLSIGNLPNSWLLPLLRSNVHEAKLSNFIDTFLPVALEITIRLAKQQTVDGERKILEALQQQIWDLLPVFCSKCNDLRESLTKIVDIVVGLLYNSPTLRLTLLSSIRTLVSTADSDEARRELVNCAPKFLPTLIKLFVSEDPSVKNVSGFDAKGVRLAVLETLRVYFTIMPATCLNPYLKVALKKLNDPTESADTKHRVMDVLVALVKHLSSPDMAELFTSVESFCDEKKCKDKSLQKKAYRVLEEAFKSDSGDAKEFFDQNRDEILAVLTSHLVKAPPSTKASKLRCLSQLFESHMLDIATAPGMLPSAILCLKENNVKTRRSAAIFFITVSNLLIADKKDTQAATKIIWDHLTNDFDSSDPVKVSCCLIAARLFIFEFKNDCSSKTLSTFMSQVVNLIGNKSRQIVQCCLEFLKTFVSCLPQVTVGQYMETFVPALYTQTEDCQHHFRFLTRKILAKLMRKVPYELIRKLVPEGPFQKQLNNVRKMLQRYEKGKLTGARTRTFTGSSGELCIEDDAVSGVTGLSRPETIAQLLKDTDDEDDADDDEPAFDRSDGRISRKRLTRRSHESNVVLCEDDGNDGDDDGDILDFMDARCASKICAGSSKFSKKNDKDNKKQNRGFKVDDQGRLIIGLDGSDDDKEEKKFDLISIGGKRKGLGDDSGMQAGKKRKKTSSLTRDDEDSEIDEALHYRPGGKGIHRDVSKDGAEASGYGADKFKARKAKGDVSGKGGVQPYAYVPFDFKQLNKRKRAGTAGRFKNLVRGAKKGAGRGTKGRGKKLKRL